MNFLLDVIFMTLFIPYLFQQIYENIRSIEIVEGSVTKSPDNAAHPSGVTLDPSSPQDDSSTEHFFFDGVRSHSCFQNLL